MQSEVDARRAVNLRRLFEPASVAVLGASENPAKPGGRPLAYLMRAGYKGQIYPINPRYEQLFGRHAYPSLAALPEPPDLVVVAIPAAGVLPAVREAENAGVGAMVIYTSGFAETGAYGAAVEREIRVISRRSGMLVCGPNCQGVANLHTGLAVNFSSALSEGTPKPGPIGIVSQSGLVGALIASECVERGLGIGYLVSTGNEAGFELSDAIGYMAGDSRIGVICGYVEGIRDVDRFRAAVEQAGVAGKPVVLMKVGCSAAGARVAATHTGSPADAAGDWDTLAAKIGIVPVDSLEDLIDATATFAQVTRRPAGRRVAVFGNSGGFAVICTDELYRNGLELAALAPDTIATIAAHVPPFIVPQNPIDLVSLPMTDADATVAVLRKVAADPGVDAIVCCFGAVREKVEELTKALSRFAAEIDKPLVIAWLASAPAGAKALAEHGIAVYSDPSRAVRSVRLLLNRP